ncbi:hypothetical protein IEQ34_009674 [Dendrobium chrysotoxum]|uniref:Uncharacterized protein n=1 Tax=Dendrobium chrysotoxum TaxID=161865 RepID=A0AAV7H220_DENCH|nr:hypothetical protein IEQ34_009674 [Dendrobium chrysotoxum]
MEVFPPFCGSCKRIGHAKGECRNLNHFPCILVLMALSLLMLIITVRKNIVVILDNLDNCAIHNIDVVHDDCGVLNANVVDFGSIIAEIGNVTGLVVDSAQLDFILPVGVPVYAEDKPAPSIDVLPSGDNIIGDDAIKVTNNCLTGPGTESIFAEEDFPPLPTSGGVIVARETINCMDNCVTSPTVSPNVHVDAVDGGCEVLSPWLVVVCLLC